MPGAPDIAKAVETARGACEAAAAASMRWFRRDANVQWKSDGSPVTNADRDAEAAILKTIRAAFPSHAILTEETGAHAGDARTRWIVDPLDGTHRFARGFRTWGPLVALEHDGEVIAGALALPALGETWWAGRGAGCWRNGERARVSDVREWKQANLSVGSTPRLLGMACAEGLITLMKSASYVSAGNDLMGAALVLAGHCDAWIEGGVKVWDIAPFRIMAAEAGGVFTDLSGRDTIESGSAVVTNGALQEHVLCALNG